MDFRDRDDGNNERSGFQISVLQFDETVLSVCLPDDSIVLQPH